MDLIEMTNSESTLLWALLFLIRKDNEEQKSRLYPALRNYAEVILFNEALINYNCSPEGEMIDPTEGQINDLIEKAWLNRACILEDWAISNG